jgi:phenylacetate-CoA ligase
VRARYGASKSTAAFSQAIANGLGKIFYRELYSGHGIREHQLGELSVSDLPFVTKKLLMENFDRAVTDSRLRKSALERWLNDVRDPRQLFQREFIVMHTSGSSGTIGIFVYSRADWNIMNSVMAGRLPQPENYPAGKTRVGFLGSRTAISRVSRPQCICRTRFTTP